ncbi:helix-turn-helix transcriptional regulator [Aurantivibrio infirmus]
MTELADSQEALLLKLKQKGPQTAKALAELLNITTMGVRQHLKSLSEKAYVEQIEETKQLRGRPVKPWKLSKKGHQFFPDSHSQATLELIASVREVFGEPGLDQLINQRTATTLEQYRQELASSIGLAERIKSLSQIREREGYMSEVKKNGKGKWLLIENHCPICAAAESCQGFCRSELEVFQALFENIALVERIEHILLGARRCAYKITSIEK